MQSMLSSDPHTLLVGLLVAGILLTVLVSWWIRSRRYLPSFLHWIPTSITVKEKGVTVGRTTIRLAFPTHPGPVYALDWSPDGSFLAATQGNQVQVWKMSQGKLMFTHPGYSGTVRSLRWSPSNSFIALGTDDGTFHLWHFTRSKGNSQEYMRRTTGEIVCLAWSPEGTRCACGMGKSIALFSGEWPYVSQEPLGDAHTTPVQCLVWSEGARYIASSGDDGEVLLWDTEVHGGRLVARYQVMGNAVASLTFAASDTRVVAGYADGTVRVWGIPNSASSRVLDMGVLIMREPLRSSHEHFGKVTALSCSPNGTRVASGGNDMKVRVWDAMTGDFLLDYFIGSPALDLRWSPNGKHIAIGAESVSLQVLALPSHKR